MKKVLTDQDFIENPELTAMGFKPGDEAELPEPGLKERPVEENGQTKHSNAATDGGTFEPGSADDTGGGAPPTNKPRG